MDFLFGDVTKWGMPKIVDKRGCFDDVWINATELFGKAPVSFVLEQPLGNASGDLSDLESVGEAIMDQ